ncbi:hypothetical protein Avbf_12450 [Armadillidium vulgare]|nr:hypothetical protein Avbf_12450 [Armadillidium vulgare]
MMKRRWNPFLRAGADQTAELYGTDVTPIQEAKRRKYYNILKKMVAMKPAKPPPKSSKEEFIALEDVKRLFEDFENEEDVSSDESEDEELDPDEDAHWKMHNAPIVLSAKELLEEEEKSFWDHWEEKPKVISAKEYFKENTSWWETASSSSDEISSTSSDEKDSDDDAPTFEELKKSWGKVVPAKEFFREDECWWRDAVEDLDKPKVILAKEFFKEKTAWWEQSSSDEDEKRMSQLQKENSRPEESKIISSKDLFPEDIPWWQTENSSEDESENDKKYLTSDSKINKSEEKSEEESSVYEDIEESLTEDWETANDSVMSDSSTMYSVSDGEKLAAADLFVENPWWYNEDDQTDNSVSEDKLSEDRSDRTETTEVAEDESYIDVDKYDGRTRILSSTDSDASTNIIIDAFDSNSIENLLELDIDEDHQEQINAPQYEEKILECSNKSKNNRNVANEDNFNRNEHSKTESEKCASPQDSSNKTTEKQIVCKSIISEKEKNDTKPKNPSQNIENSRLELKKSEEPDSLNMKSKISSAEFSNDINKLQSKNDKNESEKHFHDLNRIKSPENVSNDKEIKVFPPVIHSFPEITEQNCEKIIESKSHLCESLKQPLVNDKAVLSTIVQNDKRLVKGKELDDKEGNSNLSNNNMTISNNEGKMADISQNDKEVITSFSRNSVIIPNIHRENDILKERENVQANIHGSNISCTASNFNNEKSNKFLDSLKTDILELESNPLHSQHENRTLDSQSSLTHINLNNTLTDQNVNDSSKCANEKSLNTNPPVTNKMNACLARVDATLAWLDARMANDSLNATLSNKSSSLPCIPKPTFSKTPKSMIHESLERVHENDSTHQTSKNKCKDNFSIFRLKIRINDQHASNPFEHYSDKSEDDSNIFTRDISSNKYALHNSEGCLHKLNINGNNYTNRNKGTIKKCNSIAKLETTRLQDYDLQKSDIMSSSNENFTKISEDSSRQPVFSKIFKSKYSKRPDVFSAERRHSVGDMMSEGNNELSKNSNNLQINVKNCSKKYRRHSFDETILKVKGILADISPFITNLKKSEKENKMMFIATSDQKVNKEVIPNVQPLKNSEILNPSFRRQENDTSDKSDVTFDTFKEPQLKKKSSPKFCSLISLPQPYSSEFSSENTRTCTLEKNGSSKIKTAPSHSTTGKPVTTIVTRTTTVTTTTATDVTTTTPTTTTNSTITTTNTNNNNSNNNTSRANSISEDKSCFHISSNTCEENLTKILEPVNISGKETDHMESTFHLSKMNNNENIRNISAASDDSIISDPLQKRRPKPFECVKLTNDLKDGFCLENYVTLSNENLSLNQGSLERLFPTNKCVTESNLRIKPPLPPRRNKDNRLNVK